MRNSNIAFSLVFSVLSLQLYATTYYVSPTGKNTGSGTSVSSAWQSCSKINMKNFRGDTILFQGGNSYPGRLYFDSLDIGSSTKPIVIGTYGTGKATINSDTSFGIYAYNTAGFKIKNLIIAGSGRTTNTSTGIFFYMDKSATILNYIRIENVEVYGYRNAGICVGSWNYASGFNDVSVTYSDIHDNGESGIFFYAQSPRVHKKVYIGYDKVYNNPGIATKTTMHSGNGILLGHVDGAVVEYSVAYNNGWLNPCTTNGPNGIWTYESNNVVMQFNESHHNKTNSNKDGGGFDIDGGCTNSIMQYNYSHDNDGGGFLAAQQFNSSPFKNNIIRYNITENDGRKNGFGGLHIWSSGANGGIQNLEIYNNTVYLTPAPSGTPKAITSTSGGIYNLKVRNNIFQVTGGLRLVNIQKPTTSYYFQGNDYWPSGGAFNIYWADANYTSLSAWRTAKGQEKINTELTGLQVDPQFSNSTTGVTFNDATQITKLTRYKLKSTSGLINTGLNLTSRFATNIGTRDFWGNSLSNKTQFNIGAYQLTTGARPEYVFETDQDNQVNEQRLKIFPNPVSASSSISFKAPETGKVSVEMYSMEGKFVGSIFTGELKAGDNKIVSLNGQALSKGAYIVRLYSRGKGINQTIIVVR